jgi:hypothetical protein
MPGVSVHRAVDILVGKRAWVIERNGREIYMLSHSQVCHHQTPLFLWMTRWKAFDMTAIAAMGGAEQQRVLASYYRYFVLWLFINCKIA